MNDQIERLLNSLPKKKLSRAADLKIRFRLLRIQLAQAWHAADFSLAKGWQAGLASILVLLIGLSGTGAYAYASDKVNRQSRLYPIKRTLETIEKTAAKSPAARTSLESKLAARRLAEARTLIDSSADPAGISDALDLTLTEARQNIESANKDLEAIESAADRDQAAEKLGAENRKQAQRLEQIAGKLSLEGDEMIVDAVAATLENLEQQDGFLKKRTSAAGIQPTSTPADRPEARPTTAATSPLAASSSEEAKRSDDLESFNQLKSRVEAFKTEQKSKLRQQPNLKAEKFIKNLEKKIDQAESSIKQGDKEGFIKLYQATNALTNTADHFIASSTGKKAGPGTEQLRRPEDRRETIKRREQDSERSKNERNEKRD